MRIEQALALIENNLGAARPISIENTLVSME